MLGVRPVYFLPHLPPPKTETNTKKHEFPTDLEKSRDLATLYLHSHMVGTELCCGICSLSQFSPLTIIPTKLMSFFWDSWLLYEFKSPLINMLFWYIMQIIFYPKSHILLKNVLFNGRIVPIIKYNFHKNWPAQCSYICPRL